MSVLEVEQLERRDGSHVAGRDVSFRAESSEVFGLLGSNDAGKTSAQAHEAAGHDCDFALPFDDRARG